MVQTDYTLTGIRPGERMRGEGGEDARDLQHLTGISVRTGTRKGPPQMTPSIHYVPEDLDDLVDWGWPDALMVEFKEVSLTVYLVTILDVDYTYTEWLATLSLDHRWTLSPRAGPFRGTPINIDWGKDGPQ